MLLKLLILFSALGSVKFRYVDVIILPRTPFTSSSFSVSSSCSPLKFMKATLKQNDLHSFSLFGSSFSRFQFWVFVISLFEIVTFISLVISRGTFRSSQYFIWDLNIIKSHTYYINMAFYQYYLYIDMKYLHLFIVYV